MTSPRTAPARTAVLTLVLAVVVALGRFATAQPAGPAPDDRTQATEAAALYDEGKRHFDIGEYAQAIASWKQAYLRSSAPLLLFNIAQAYRLSGNCAQANRFYLNYRRVEKHPRNQAELDKAMARCAGIEPATGDAASEPAASTAGTAGAAGTPGSPAGGAAPAPAAVTVPGAAAEPAPSPARGNASTAPSDAAAPPPPGPAPVSVAERTATSPSTGHGWRITGIVTGAVGVAALAAGGIYAIGAQHDSDTVSGSRTGTPYTGDVVSTDSHGRTAANRARGLVGVGAALAVAGGVMWYIGHRQGALLDVAIAPGHAEVALSCAF